MNVRAVPSPPLPGECWWCGRIGFEPGTLLHLEGARLAGSEPLALPREIPEEWRGMFVVCEDCAVVFGRLRIRVDNERKAHGWTVGDRFRSAAEGTWSDA